MRALKSGGGQNLGRDQITPTPPCSKHGWEISTKYISKKLNRLNKNASQPVGNNRHTEQQSKLGRKVWRMHTINPDARTDQKEWTWKKNAEAKALWFFLFCFTAIRKTPLRFVSMCGLPLVGMQVSAITMGCHKVKKFLQFFRLLGNWEGGEEVITGMISFRPACLLYKGKKTQKTPRKIKKTDTPALARNF